MRKSQESRKGAITPLFALILPVLIVLAAMALNIAYLQLSSTELRIATDASAHAAGRSMSINQTTSAAIETAQQIAAMNKVAGKQLSLTTSDSDNDITFGLSLRQNDGYGRYSFTPYTQDEVDNGSKTATSIAINVGVDVPLIFANFPGVPNSIVVNERSVATQVDRDIVLVLDRSGSMLYYENETALEDALALLLATEGMVETQVQEPGHYEYKWYIFTGSGFSFVGWASFSEASENGWVWYSPSSETWVEGDWVTELVPSGESLISQQEYEDATDFLYDRTYSDNVIEQLLTINEEMSEYAQGWQDMLASHSNWNHRSPAPPHSRWSFLVQGVDEFLKVLEGTEQDEHVGLVVFNHDAYLEQTIGLDYDGVRDELEDICPYNGTSIGEGIDAADPELMGGANARLFAQKTILVMSDGESQDDPVTVAGDITQENPITIHTLTFATDNQNAKDDMRDIAEEGHGKYYHADTGDELIATFTEIANNLPTILSE